MTPSTTPRPDLRVTLLTQYYAPEKGAPQTRLRETVRYLIGANIRVNVVTGPPHYPDGAVATGFSPWRPTIGDMDGARIVRLPMIPRPNSGFVDRLVDQGSFAFTALAALALVPRTDVFLVESPPLFLGGTAVALHAVTSRPFVFHVADPWPDFPIAIGALSNRRLIDGALWLERLIYENAALITTPTPPWVERLSAKPGAKGKVRLVPNAVDVNRFEPGIEPADARRRLGWPDRPTLVYAGSVGLAQGVGTLLDALQMVPPELEFQVNVLGQGAEAAQVAELARNRRIDRITFLPPAEAAEIPSVLAAADAILVMLRRGPLHAEAAPTKLLEGMAAGRPIIVSADGFASRLVTEAGAGLTAPAEDPTGLAQAIEDMVRAKNRPALGRAATIAARSFSREASAEQLRLYLLEAATS